MVVKSPCRLGHFVTQQHLTATMTENLYDSFIASESTAMPLMRLIPFAVLCSLGHDHTITKHCPLWPIILQVLRGGFKQKDDLKDPLSTILCFGNFRCLGSQRHDLLPHSSSLKTCHSLACKVWPSRSTGEGDEGHKRARLDSSLPAASRWPAGRNTGKPPANRSPRAGGVLPPREFAEPPPSLLAPLGPFERRGQ